MSMLSVLHTQLLTRTDALYRNRSPKDSCFQNECLVEDEKIITQTQALDFKNLTPVNARYVMRDCVIEIAGW
jgi:hypothetical protein